MDASKWIEKHGLPLKNGDQWLSFLSFDVFKMLFGCFWCYYIMGLSSAVGHRSPNSLCHADGCNAWGPIGGPQGDNVCIQPSVSLGRLSGKCPHAFPELIAWENDDLKLCASCACTARIATNIYELIVVCTCFMCAFWCPTNAVPSLFYPSYQIDENRSVL